ncbi:efflux transporter SmeDEF transcriptional repressor SmeT [Stenotrophomonas maltophilia group sp. P373]|uniref:TetR family transcriptional regulator n=1 Tax=Stenotrophomonas maltophilia TaxID=40324 RepID=A0A270NE20_STEMA|nr:MULTISPECIES: efflux transporter SmeDEF transcriptional repressor SmeT [Stenotrophomonas]AYA91979.1 TetR family transcriptional regulator [Stenotrophomonas sp. Pemsol]MCF3523849.1 efflux transporter SmeDEF transcriptional repressor SmeT [Stenotrophomonas maltophilia]MCF3552592.1 efflux transporter SmeDEF transcriptional repressor SmeT [Stenotrophomonas maltophilia]MCU1202651.1 efflux transporter SmeDEF transcriptional repressor SmeT [Stenotrophomonas maltophilia]PAM70277.1 TetR family trans
MARKTKEDTQATREGILDAAEACFHEHGVARTTLEMIGARAGYTRGAVYWHFKNKSEVLAAIVERVHLPFMQELERTSTDQRDTPVHDLRAVMIHSFIELSEDERLRKTMEIMLRSDASADTKVLTELQQAGFRDGLDRMERALRRAKDLGQLREGADPKIAARMLHATVLGVLHGAMVEPELMDLKRDGMLALDMTLAAYVKDGVFVPGTVPEPLPEA